jgi:hypothetical protein
MGRSVVAKQKGRRYVFLQAFSFNLGRDILMYRPFQCLERDGDICIISGTANPEACHIVPFAFNSSEENLNARLLDPLILLAASPAGDIEDLLTAKLGCSDKSWNTLTLNSQLHIWCGSRYLALKCLGIFPVGPDSIIRIQFRWMQRNVQKGLDEDISEQLLSGVRESLTGCGIISMAKAESSRKVLSGDVFEIRMEAEDALKMKIMLDLQWALGDDQTTGKIGPRLIRHKRRERLRTVTIIALAVTRVSADPKAGCRAGLV